MGLGGEDGRLTRDPCRVPHVHFSGYGPQLFRHVAAPGQPSQVSEALTLQLTLVLDPTPLSKEVASLRKSSVNPCV